jgi:hypothetical protein
VKCIANIAYKMQNRGLNGLLDDTEQMQNRGLNGLKDFTDFWISALCAESLKIREIQ